MTEDDVKLLKGIGIDKMQFSLDSIDGGIIQVMVGGSKAYVEKVKKMFLYCQQNGVSLNVRSVITIHNGTVENFKELYDFCLNSKILLIG